MAVEWVVSGGGPLIILPHGLLPYWGGADPPEEGLIPSGPASDYDRACAVGEEIALIEVGPGHGLVLGEEPLHTAWWNVEGSDDPFVVRAEYADPKANFDDMLSQLRHVQMIDLAMRLRVEDEGDLVLFDSAMPGTDIAGSCDSAKVAPGEYAILQGRFRPDTENSFWVYQLQRRG